MRTKKNKSKLALNKISIAHLDKVKIHEVKGGLPPDRAGAAFGTTCAVPCYPTCNPPRICDLISILVCNVNKP